MAFIVVFVCMNVKRVYVNVSRYAYYVRLCCWVTVYMCDKFKLDHAKALGKKLVCTIANSKDMHFGLKFIDWNALYMAGMVWHRIVSYRMAYQRERVYDCFQTAMMNVSTVRPQIWPLCIYGIFVSFWIF